jgi:hypothetical protein
VRTYLVEVTAGTHSWTVTDETTPTYGLADPLTIGWTLPDTEHRPSQPDPMVATFSVVVATAADLDDLALGAPVSINVTFGPAAKPDTDVAFYGRIAQGEAAPDPRGMLYRFTCADLTADLASYDIGALAFAPVPVWQRLNHLLARAGLDPALSVVRDPVVLAMDPWLYIEGIPQPNAASLLTSLVDLCDQVGLNGLGEKDEADPVYRPGFHRPIVSAHPLNDPGSSVARWALDAVSDTYSPSAVAPMPAVFGHFYPDPQGYGLWVDPDDRAAGVIDACVVEFSSQWSAIQPNIVNRAAVTWLAADSLDPETSPRVQLVAYTAEGDRAGHKPVMAVKETQMLQQSTVPATQTAASNNAEWLGALMIPPPQNPAGWAPGAFRWLLHADPAGLVEFPMIFPRHDKPMSYTAHRTACYVRPIVVAGIPRKWNAADAGRDWAAGQLSAVTLTISDGRPVVDFELTPTVPEQSDRSPDFDTWDAAAGTWDATAGTWDAPPTQGSFRWTDPGLAGVTWNQLHPQTWNLYRLARGT